MCYVTTEARDHQLTIRIPKRVRAALEIEATHERRTVADVVNDMLAARYPHAGTGGAS
jgi:predicted HicB family RNase H-like nuclease